MFFEQFYQDSLGALPDAAVYFFMGAIGSVLFFIRMLSLFIGGVDSDFDVDVDLDGDAAFDIDHGTDFHLFNLLSIMCFMMGAGWMGLACRLEWNLGALASALIASGFGFSLMAFSSFGLWQMKKMNQSSRYDVRTCIGRTGQVYLSIPARGEGVGQVQINVAGRRSIVDARSSDAAIESFTAVKVIDVTDDEILVVEPVA